LKAAAVGLKTNALALGFNFANAFALACDPADGVGLVGIGMSLSAPSGTVMTGGGGTGCAARDCRGLKGGISGIFMAIFFDVGVAEARAAGGDLSAAGDCVFAALAFSRLTAAFASIAFCLSSSLDSRGRMSFGIGNGIYIRISDST
jgi:hypothetical protein